MCLACRSWNTTRALTPQATAWSRTSFAPYSRELFFNYRARLSGTQSLVEITDRCRNRKTLVAARVSHRLSGSKPNRQHPGPHRQSVVLFVVLHIAGAHLRGNFVERQPQNAGGF